MAVSRFVVLSPQTAILIPISLPLYATRCQHMGQDMGKWIVFYAEIGYVFQ